MKTVCIVPTYNEVENISRIIDVIRGLPVKVDMLIVDDNSPDGTGMVVKKRMEKDPHLFIIERQQKLGLYCLYCGI